MSRNSPLLEGTVLLQLRRQSGWTQRRLERKARLSRGTVSLYETGKRKLARPLLNRLALTLGHCVEAVDRALAGLAQIPASEISGAVTPASLCPDERRVVEAAAGQAAKRAAEIVRTRLSLGLIQNRVRSERRAAGKLWDQLRKLPTPETRRNRVAAEPRFHFWALCERLCDESTRAAAHDASQARELAELALQVAELTPAVPWQCRLQGYALAFVGNALRVGGDLLAADAAFDRSDEFWEAGNAAAVAPLDGSRILDLKASLRRYQGRFDEARALLSTALQDAHHPAKKTRLLLNVAALLELQGDYEEALETLKRTESWAVEAGEPRLIRILEFGRTANLCHLAQVIHRICRRQVTSPDLAVDRDETMRAVRNRRDGQQEFSRVSAFSGLSRAINVTARVGGHTAPLGG